MAASITDRVRAWAAGSHRPEAGVELLIRTNLIDEQSPWLIEESTHRVSIDPCILMDETGCHPWHQKVAAHVAAHLLVSQPIDLADLLPGLDRKTLHLILAALAHAAGSHEHGHVIVTDGVPSVTDVLPPLVAWPQDNTPQPHQLT